MNIVINIINTMNFVIIIIYNYIIRFIYYIDGTFTN